MEGDGRGLIWGKKRARGVGRRTGIEQEVVVLIEVALQRWLLRLILHCRVGH